VHEKESNGEEKEIRQWDVPLGVTLVEVKTWNVRNSEVSGRLVIRIRREKALRLGDMIRQKKYLLWGGGMMALLLRSKQVDLRLKKTIKGCKSNTAE